MSVVTGGIYSRPSGKTAGIVWGAARTRSGKLATARQLVPPSNPKTPAQLTQRSKFTSALFIVRALSPTVYQADFNRAIGQLPGFQSMQSMFLNSLTDLLFLNPPPSINLGTLHFPNTFMPSSSVAGTLQLTWSTEVGDGGTTSDLVKVLVIAENNTTRIGTNGIVTVLTTLRSAGTLAIPSLATEENYVIIAYVVGAGTASGTISITHSYSQIIAP